jgi:hypothetical protein
MRTNHIAVSSADAEGEKIGSITVDGKTTNLYYNERLNQKLVPSGTKITASSSDKKNINSLEYLKVGNYYCPQTA